MLLIELIRLVKVIENNNFGNMKSCIHVVQKVVKMYRKKYQCCENVTSVTVWFKPKRLFYRKKLHLDVKCGPTDCGVQKTHLRVASHVIHNQKTNSTFGLLLNINI